MSASPEDNVGQVDVGMVAEMFREPSYLSEVMRKLRKLNLPRGYDMGELENAETIRSTWGEVSENTALVDVMFITSVLTKNSPDDFVVERKGYDVSEGADVGQSQSVGSTHLTFTEDGVAPEKEWKPYAIVHNVADVDVGSSLDSEGYQELSRLMIEEVDPTVTIEEKAEMVEVLSRVGNEVSIYAEEIMQDAMERQFRYYDTVRTSDYNQPGEDFAVVDEDRRDYGLVIEVSTRWVNPIGKPYITDKVNSALDMEEEGISDQPWDVVILAPKFTLDALGQYEDPESPSWHADPETGMVHLHKVPSENPEVYKPFAKNPKDITQEEMSGGGNPVIIPDSKELREHIKDSGHVGDGYPVIDDDYSEFRGLLDGVFRDYVVVTESMYRNMLREAIEPLLWEFMRPYKIEQFLMDTYWDKELNQKRIGELAGVSGGTIGDWMANWKVMRRFGGAPELSQEVKDVWKAMYEGGEDTPFPKQFSGYRILAEYNRHPMWDMDDWREWYNMSSDERQETMAMQDSFRNNLDYTILAGANDRLTPSYGFIIETLREMGVEIREPDEAPRVPYKAYPSRQGLEYMINKNQDTIVKTGEQ